MIPIFFAVDTADFAKASDLLLKLGDLVDIKLGLEFFIHNGPARCKEIRNIGSKRQRQLFLDLKLHDIPTTVGNAIHAALPIEADFITVHTCEGVAPLAAAVAAADHAAELGYKRPDLLGVINLTSNKHIDDAVFEARAGAAFEAGLDGLICSASDIEMLDYMFKSSWKTMYRMVPGIRLPGSSSDDQQRVATAKQAFDAGASGIVIGRAIRDAKNPVAVAKSIIESLHT